MRNLTFPELPLEQWRGTRDTLRAYSRVIGAVREALTPRRKHWWHINLRPGVRGLVTPPIPATATAETFAFSLELDLVAHELVVSASAGEPRRMPLRGQSVSEFCEQLLQALARLNIEPEIDRDAFSETARLEYDPEAAGRFWQALGQIALVFDEFRSGMREESSPISIWSHHFDMALVWFSGRLAPGVDPADEESADEQMSFGFSTGDDVIAEPYFYISAYPMPEKLKETPLPAKVSWHSEGWNGALLLYRDLVDADDPRELIWNYLRTMFDAGRSLMR